MKAFRNLIFFIGFLLMYSCNSQDQNKISSKNYVQFAEKIVRDNKKHGEEDTTANLSLIKALTYLDKAIELDSTNSQAYQDKIMALTILGNRNSDLIKSLLKLLELKPYFAEGFMQLGLIYERLKNYDSAKLAYRQAKIGYLKRIPSDTRNSDLVFVEFLITKSKSATLEKLKEFEFIDPEIKKNLKLEIDEWVKGEY